MSLTIEAQINKDDTTETRGLYLASSISLSQDEGNEGCPVIGGDVAAPQVHHYFMSRIKTVWSNFL